MSGPTVDVNLPVEMAVLNAVFMLAKRWRIRKTVTVTTAESKADTAATTDESRQPQERRHLQL